MYIKLTVVLISNDIYMSFLQLSMLCIPCPDGGDRPIQVLELPPTAMACPPDLCK